MLVPFCRVEQALARIRMLLAADRLEGELGIFLPEPEPEPEPELEMGEGRTWTKQVRVALAGTFMACLEMAKQGEIDADQDILFDPIRICLPQAAFQKAQQAEAAEGAPRQKLIRQAQSSRPSMAWF
ncbi:hypothetical protein HN018_03745 [Lichenicola cladoniae]|uniref:Segregation and condensation protein A n=1 Tax=Lichenicola cladoniae TaxID=1484109 RepID=A0A6M8HLQ1_9PROT|nr:hypothetical protein [Lichenicola cladoniae]NPD70229.1 hypothetical protein [Acetobacteraceae bacterium]QKE89265.1 hypothetical protein HN018_03745 [Lichenicola cladoniae]